MAMTTKSGTNQFHGLASEYYQYQNLAARGEFGVPQPPAVNPYHVNNMSFALGGLVIPHKEFFFFVGYEPYLSPESNGTSLVGFEDPAFVTFAQSVEPNSPEVALMQKYPTAGMVNTKLAATAGSLYGNTLSTPAAQQACANGVGNVTAYDGISVPCSLAFSTQVTSTVPVITMRSNTTSASTSTSRRIVSAVSFSVTRLTIADRLPVRRLQPPASTSPSPSRPMRRTRFRPTP
jgi:hypothetical protein